MKSWSKADLDYLRANYAAYGTPWCAMVLGRSEGSVRNAASVHKIPCGRDTVAVRAQNTVHSKRLTGRKRPDQSLVMKGLWAEGKLKAPDAAKRVRMSEAMKAHHKTHGHPRGALGMVHTAATRERLSEVHTARWAGMTEDERGAHTLRAMRARAEKGPLAVERTGVSWKGGWRVIGGVRKYYRSRWEANYARYLEWLRTHGKVAAWAHEPETFWFAGIKRGSVTYLPDFRVTLPNGSVEYHEVKGWMDARSRTKLRRMAKYHPAVRLLVIDGKAYRSLERSVGALVAEWEFSTRGKAVVGDAPVRRKAAQG
jgi:hypothetical protein